MGTTVYRRLKREGVMRSYRIGNSASVAVGEYICLNSSGDAVTIADTAGYIPLGFAVDFSDKDTANGTDTGNTSATPPPEVVVDCGGGIVEGLTVAGAAGTAADKGKYVYGTAADTWTLTEADNLPAIGEVVRSKSATDIDVYFYPNGAIGAAGATAMEDKIFVGSVHTTALEGTAELALKRHVMQGDGKITRARAIPSGFDANYSTGSQVIVFFVGSTECQFTADLTLVETAIDSSSTIATEITSGTLSSGGTWSDGDTLLVRLQTGGTAFNAGVDNVHFDIWLDVVRHPQRGN